jgi:DNA-directed RNA polymerase specialized sigma24 family protein
MPVPLRVPPNSVTDSDVAQKVLPRDRISAVTALFEEHYASLVRMARLLVDDHETAEDVVMDAFTSLYRRWTAVRDPAEAHRYVRSCVLNGARSHCGVAGYDAATQAEVFSRRRRAMVSRRTKLTAAPLRSC